MLIPIPLGYFVSIFLIVSGVLNCVECWNERAAGGFRAGHLADLAEAGWPIMVASVILLLIQINRQLESLRLEAAREPEAVVPVVKLKKKVPAEAAAAPAMAAAAQVPVARAQVAAPKQVYPNSPIPGGGRVPLSKLVPADMPAADGVAPAGAVKRAPSRDEAGKLSYFKVD